MLICLVLCAAAVLPTAISDRPEAQNVQPHPGRNNEMARRLAASYAAARNQGLLRLRKYEEGEPAEEDQPYFFDIFVNLLDSKPYNLYSAAPQRSESELAEENILSRSLDQIGGGHLLPRQQVLDPIGGGHLLRRGAILNSVVDEIGGGHLLPRQQVLDPIGGGHLLRRGAILNPVVDEIGGGHLLRRQLLDQTGGERLVGRGNALDPIGGGLLLKRSNGFRALDPIGGGHLLKRDGLDEIGGGNLLKRRSLDSIGGGHLLKKAFQQERGEDVAEEKLSSSDTDSEAYVQ